MKVLEDLKVQKEMDRELLISVARTALRTKVAQKLADQLAEVGTTVFDYLLAVPYLYY